jgi:hypothetical protein
MQIGHIIKFLSIFVVLSMTLLFTTIANAQDKGFPARSGSVSPSSNIKVGNRTLQRTAFQTNGDSVGASCATSGCEAKAPIFVRTAQCDGAIGKTCTLYIHVDSQVSVSNLDVGAFKFLVDGVPPTPGPTGDTGSVGWNGASSSAFYEAHSFAVVAYVTNKTVNQQHTIEVDVDCFDEGGDGCVTDAGFATLQATVYTP